MGRLFLCGLLARLKANSKGSSKDLQTGRTREGSTLNDSALSGLQR